MAPAGSRDGMVARRAGNRSERRRDDGVRARGAVRTGGRGVSCRVDVRALDAGAPDHYREETRTPRRHFGAPHPLRSPILHGLPGDPSRYRMLAAGDLNLCYGATEASWYEPVRVPSQDPSPRG